MHAACYTIYSMLCNYRAKFNPLMLCNMDKNLIFRSFNLVKVEDSDSQVAHTELVMHSQYEGEFGRVCMAVHADLDSQFPDLHATFLMVSAESAARIYDFRINEVIYFTSKILPLFNPLTYFGDGLQKKSQTPESPEL